MPSQQVIARERLVPACPVVLRGMPTPPELVGSVVRRGDVVLDFGCGDAYMRGPVEDAGAHYVGLDPHSASAQLVASLPLPLAAGSVDVVVAWGVLHLLSDPFQAMAEIRRVLRPGGRVVGYAAYLEHMQEMAQFQPSFVGLETLARAGGLALTRLYSGGYGLDILLADFLLPFGRAPRLRRLVRAVTRSCLRGVSFAQGAAYALARRGPRSTVRADLAFWTTMRAVSFSSGFAFLMARPEAPEAAVPFALREALRSPATLGPVEHLALDALTLPAPAGATGWLLDRAAGTAWPVLGDRYLLTPGHAQVVPGAQE